MTTPDDHWFGIGFRCLEEEFAARGELERRSVLERRLARHPLQPVRGSLLLYRMMLLLEGDECAAVRDHTAIMRLDAPDEVIVHLSHALVVPTWRRRGLSAVLRALPLRTARECADACGRRDGKVTLVAEMEALDALRAETWAPLLAYAKAGFLKLHPHVGYQQPDFRSFTAIDASGGPLPVPLDLVVRPVGREGAATMPGAEVRHVVRCLYEMYAAECRAQDMRSCFEWLERIGNDGRLSYALISPAADDAPTSSPA